MKVRTTFLLKSCRSVQGRCYHVLTPILRAPLSSKVPDSITAGHACFDRSKRSDVSGRSRSDSGPKVGEDLSYFTGYCLGNTNAVFVSRRKAVIVVGAGRFVIVGRGRSGTSQQPTYRLAADSSGACWSK